MSDFEPEKTRITIREATHKIMRDLGMTTIFGNPGSTELPFFKNWPADFQYIMALHEGAAIAMADGYAQVKRNAAFVSLHSAAGVGNSLGNLFTSYRNQTPLVVVAGQQSRAMFLTEPYLYAKEATEFPKPYVKWSYEPARAEDVPAALMRAYFMAMQKPCGPVFLSIPQDDWDREIETGQLTRHEVSFEIGPDPVALLNLVEALNKSEQPALIVGPGVDRDGAWNLVVELAERTKARVWVSPLSSRASFPEDHSLFAGFLPPVRRQLSEKLRGHDVVVVLGAPIFTYHVYSEGNFVPSETWLYQIIDDPEAAAWSPVGYSIRATLRLALAQLLELVPSSNRPQPSGRQAFPAPEATNPISGEFVMHSVSNLMPSEAVIVEEAPTHRNVMHDYLPIKSSGGFYTGASGGLGYSLPAAVGVALADPSRKVICIVGDGSSLYSIQALWTAAQQNLPVTVIVLNNRQYAALKAFSQILAAEKPPEFDLPGIDFVALAQGFGCKACRVEKAEELATTLSEAFAANVPTLVEVIVDPAIPPLY